MITHHNLVAAVTLIFHDDIFPDKAVVLNLLPFYHIYALLVMMGGCLHLGRQLVLLPRFEPEAFLKTLQDYKVSLLFIMLENLARHTRDFSCAVFVSGQSLILPLLWPVAHCLQPIPCPERETWSIGTNFQLFYNSPKQTSCFIHSLKYTIESVVVCSHCWAIMRFRCSLCNMVVQFYRFPLNMLNQKYMMWVQCTLREVLYLLGDGDVKLVDPAQHCRVGSWRPVTRACRRFSAQFSLDSVCWKSMLQIVSYNITFLKLFIMHSNSFKLHLIGSWGWKI